MRRSRYRVRAATEVPARFAGVVRDDAVRRPMRRDGLTSRAA